MAIFDVRPSRRACFHASLCALASGVLGCGQKTEASLHTVRGAVFFNGKPATGARVAFHSLDQPARQPLPQGAVEPDGSFHLSTFVDNDGAAVGRYAVTVVWPSDSKKEEDGTPAGPDRLGRRFADPKTTPLRAEIQAGDNTLEPFPLR